jgi:hypothetical protein
MKKILIYCLFWATLSNYAQTENDGIMMDKKQLCSGLVYQYSSFDQYWEGTYKRENLNIGSVSTKNIAFMGNYGITDRWNAILTIPYIKTNATAGTLLGQKGFQDISLSIKYLAFDKTYKTLGYSAYLVGGFSVPMTDYVADFLPLSIGMQSKTASLRIMGDIQKGDFYTTFSGTYVKRDNIKIDRNAYFTDEYHYTNEVFMPDLITFNFRLGYRTPRLIADVFYDSMVTQKGGFDITKNNMPFPSNTMNMSKIGVYAKYTLKQISNLSLIGGYSYVVDGRNVGQSAAINGGVFYVLDFNKKAESNKL